MQLSNLLLPSLAPGRRFYCILHAVEQPVVAQLGAGQVVYHFSHVVEHHVFAQSSAGPAQPCFFKVAGRGNNGPRR